MLGVGSGSQDALRQGASGQHLLGYDHAEGSGEQPGLDLATMTMSCLFGGNTLL